MTNVTIPSILTPFTEELLKKQRPFISIKATPLDCDINDDPLALTQSKFLGNPFIPEDMHYPLDDDGNPLVLIVQINFSELPNLEGFPTDGILQLYMSPDQWWDASGMEKIVYLNNDELKKPPKATMPTFDADLYEELPIWKIHRLSFEKKIDTGSSEDSQFNVDFGGKDYWDFEESLNEKDKKEFNEYFTGEGHKIGGYAYFTQSDPRDYEKNKQHDIQLLQIDTDEEIMFGDSGIGHIFISPDHLAKNELDKAYFYWDCC